MKTIGEILKNARLNKNLTLGQIEDVTKIRTSFIQKIEEEKWEELPAFPTVLGFVKSIAAALNLDINFAAAVLKRDYPPKKIPITPKPDVVQRFVWSPKLTFSVGVGLAFFLIIGYLISQYLHFRSAPTLILDSPKNDQVVSGGVVNVYGSTDSDAKIVINSQPVEVSDDGKFSYNLDVVQETKEVDVVASSRSGKTTEVKRTIIVQDK